MSIAMQSGRGGPRPRVLVAATNDAIELVRRVVGAHVELVTAGSIEEALAQLDGVDLVVCNLRFHDSRVFDFLRLLAARPHGRRVPVVCCRTRAPLYSDSGVELALRELGVDSFVDVAVLERRLGAAAAADALRSAVVAQLEQRSR